MPRDQAKADQLAPSHFDGPHHNAAIRATAMCGVRRSSALGYAVADGGRAGQAAGAHRVNNRRGALGSVKQHLAIGAVKLVVSCTIDAQASGKICAPVGVEANSICVRHVASLPISPSVGAPQPFSRSPRLSISISSCPQL